MIDRERTFFAVLLALLIYPGDNLGGAFQPEFVKPLANLTIPVGRDAVFTCLVEHLGGYRVGWVKVDTKAIQAIHEHVITHNPRVSVSHGDHTTWSLRIKGVQKDDEGLYMCQINTDPMKSQTGMLTIEVPPDFRADETSGDVTVQEGWHVKLTCKADGVPRPRITWRREDQKEIIIRESFHEKSTSSSEKIKVRKSQEFIGEELLLTKIKRDQMGVYHCIASNGVPPSISKRITVDVHFPPMIHVPNQLVGAPLGTDVRLECVVEASPLSINYWLNNKNVMIVSGGRFQVQEMKLQEEKNVVLKSHHTAHSHYNFKVRMLLSIRNFTKHDSGTYKCTAKNSGGDYESSIRLYEMSRWSGQQSTNEAAFPKPAQQEPGGDRAESPGGYEPPGEQPPLDNTVQGHVGSGQQPPTPTARSRRPPHQQPSAASVEPSLRPRLALVLPLLLLCR